MRLGCERLVVARGDAKTIWMAVLSFFSFSLLSGSVHGGKRLRFILKGENKSGQMEMGQMNQMGQMHQMGQNMGQMGQMRQMGHMGGVSGGMGGMQ